MTAPKRRYPPNNVKANRKPCTDCVAEGITSKRKAPYPGPRCASHNRIKRATRRDTSWGNRIQAVYGITALEYAEILDYQGGVCALCRRAKGLRKRLSVDHDHRTGVVRGALCVSCNRNVLGHARDEIEFFERCIEYLMYPPAVAVLGERVVPDHVPDLTLNGDDGEQT